MDIVSRGRVLDHISSCGDVLYKEDLKVGFLKKRVNWSGF